MSKTKPETRREKYNRWMDADQTLYVAMCDAWGKLEVTAIVRRKIARWSSGKEEWYWTHLDRPGEIVYGVKWAHVEETPEAAVAALERRQEGRRKSLQGQMDAIGHRLKAAKSWRRKMAKAAKAVGGAK